VDPPSPLSDDAGTLRADVARHANEEQRSAFLANRAIALLHSNHLDRCRESLNALKREEEEGRSLHHDAARVALIDAALCMRNRRPADADAALARFVDGRGATDAGARATAQLARAQIAASAGEYAKAISALEGVGAACATSPAVTATIVALRELSSDAAGADAALEAAAATPGAPTTLALRAAERELERGRTAEAVAAYERVLSLGARDDGDKGDEDDLKLADAGLVKARAVAGDADGAERGASEVFDALLAARGGEAPDADALEETPPDSVLARAAEVERRLAARRGGKRGVGGDDDDGGGERATRRKRRKRKIVYPKGFDPENPGPMPDPERWLPKRERSGHKGKKKKQANVRGAQGAGASDAELSKKEFSGGGAGGTAGGGGGGKTNAPDADVMDKLLSAGAGKKKKKGGRR